jgi:hypothetical protein
MPKVTVEPISENGYISQRLGDSPEVGPMNPLTEEPEDNPIVEAKKEEEQMEPPPPQSESPPPSPASPSSSEAEESSEETSETETDSEGEWAGTDYVTRCVCGMQHNDEFMISCDKCEVWQHCRCMGIDTRRVPDQYLCEQCNPRALKISPEKAREIQTK